MAETWTRRILGILRERLGQEYPDWAGPDRWDIHEEPEDQFWCRISVPNRQDHILQFRVEINSIEVAYEDSLPPGAAEKLFVFEPWEAPLAIDDGVLVFVRQLVEEKWVVVRERLPIIFRLIRGFDCRSLPWFRNREIEKIIRWNTERIYSWNGTYDYQAK